MEELVLPNIVRFEKRGIEEKYGVPSLQEMVDKALDPEASIDVETATPKECYDVFTKYFNVTKFADILYKAIDYYGVYRVGHKIGMYIHILLVIRKMAKKTHKLVSKINKLIRVHSKLVIPIRAISTPIDATLGEISDDEVKKVLYISYLIRKDLPEVTRDLKVLDIEMYKKYKFQILSLSATLQYVYVMPTKEDLKKVKDYVSYKNIEGEDAEIIKESLTYRILFDMMKVEKKDSFYEHTAYRG